MYFWDVASCEREQEYPFYNFIKSLLDLDSGSWCVSQLTYRHHSTHTQDTTGGHVGCALLVPGLAGNVTLDQLPSPPSVYLDAQILSYNNVWYVARQHGQGTRLLVVTATSSPALKESLRTHLSLCHTIQSCTYKSAIFLKCAHFLKIIYFFLHHFICIHSIKAWGRDPRQDCCDCAWCRRRLKLYNCNGAQDVHGLNTPLARKQCGFLGGGGFVENIFFLSHVSDDAYYIG